jgi:hypothetical protein
MQAQVIHSPPLRRGIAISVVLHAAAVAVLLWRASPEAEEQAHEHELVDIEVAPAAPQAEALPAETAKAAEEADDVAERTPMQVPDEGEEAAADAGVVDAPPDAGEDNKVAVVEDAAVVEPDAAAQDQETTTDPAVEGAPTTAGTAANLLAYFPPGHTITALVRFDRLRGTEWAKPTETLLQPMPDYRLLFGTGVANVCDKLDTLVISTPRPKDATATTLVAHTHMARAALREFLEATTPVQWSAAKGGLLGKRGGKLPPGDQRIFLSPFEGWFLLAQPGDIGGLVAPAGGDVDRVVATAKLPSWLAGIRAIEQESGADRGPALVVTIGLPGKRFELGANDFGLGVSGFPTPERISAALELVKQGWLVRGNMRFASEADAAEFVTAAEGVRQRITQSTVIQLAVGKPLVRVIANLSFSRAGQRVSYATSISIADFRVILAVAAQHLESYFRSQR